MFAVLLRKALGRTGGGVGAYRSALAVPVLVPLFLSVFKFFLGFLEPTRGSLSYIVRRIPKGLLRVTSLWFLIPLIVLMALESPPSAPGRILQKFGADFVAGWLCQLVFLSLLIDALKGTLPRAAMLILIIFYSSYYFEFWQQGVQYVKPRVGRTKKNKSRNDRSIRF